MTESSLVASELIEANTVEYAKYMLTHHFTSPIDGLKKVKRRILASQPVDKPFSGVSLIANTLKLHPYGDQSTYEAAGRMTDVFRSEHQLLTIRGTGGSYGGDNAPAARYTDFQISDFAREILFSDIDFKTIPTEQTEDLMGYEIKYFIPKLPTALLYENESVGFGYSSRILPLKFDNVCTLVADFINSKNKAKWDGKHLIKLMVPHFPIHINMVNVTELVQAYKSGNYQAAIETEGIYRIMASNRVLIKTMYYGSTVENVRSSVESIIKDKNHWVVKEFDATLICLSEDVNYADFDITIKRGMNIFEFISRLGSVLRIRGRCYPKNNFVYQDRFINLDIPGIIRLWYAERYRSKLGTLKYKQQKLYLTQMKLVTYMTVCDHTDEVIKKLRSSDPEEFTTWIRDRFDLSPRQGIMLMEANLQILMKTKRAELEAQLENTNRAIETINVAFTSIDTDLVEEIGALKRKFNSQSRFCSVEPSYIGCLIIGDLGIIQINDVMELDHLSSIFNVKKRFVQYPTNLKELTFARQRGTYKPETVPYTVFSPGVTLSTTDGKKMFVRKNRGVLVDSQQLVADDAVVNLVSPNAKSISADGIIADEHPGIEPSKGSVKLLFMFDTVSGIDEYWVISSNSNIPGYIRIQRTKLADKVIISAGGTTTILDVVPVTENNRIVQAGAGSKHDLIEVSDITKYMKKSNMVDVAIRNFNKY